MQTGEVEVVEREVMAEERVENWAEWAEGVLDTRMQEEDGGVVRAWAAVEGISPRRGRRRGRRCILAVG